jgi:hypothetical protein
MSVKVDGELERVELQIDCQRELRWSTGEREGCEEGVIACPIREKKPRRALIWRESKSVGIEKDKV